MSYSEAKLCEVTSSSNKTWRIKKIWGRTSSAVKNLLRKPTGESSHCTVLRCRSLIFRKTDRTFFGNLNHWRMHSTDPGMRRLNIFRWLQLPAPNKLSYSDSRKIHNFLMILFLSVHLNINLVNDLSYQTSDLHETFTRCNQISIEINIYQYLLFPYLTSVCDLAFAFSWSSFFEFFKSDYNSQEFTNRSVQLTAPAPCPCTGLSIIFKLDYLIEIKETNTDIKFATHL